MARLSLTAQNFLEYPWHSWDEAIRHYAETYGQEKQFGKGFSREAVVKRLISQLRKASERDVDESTFADIKEAADKYLARLGKAKRSNPSKRRSKLHTGPRGGKYHIRRGRRVYV